MLGGKSSKSEDTANPDPYKERMMEKIHVITMVAKDSPLAQVPADVAIHWLCEHINPGEIDQGTFLKEVRELATKFNITVSDQHIIEVFKTIDFDESGSI